MKILKTFLFTISLSFLSFGVVSLNGFCQALPQLDPSSFEVIQGTNRNDAFVGFSPEMSVYMIDQIYNNINQDLYDTYGYDLEDVANESEQISYEIMTGQRPSLTSNNYISSSTMDWIAQKFTKSSVNTMASLISAGYKLYGQVYPQWGRNVKQFFVGKENNGVISDVTTTVKYFTDEGFNNYSSMLNKQIQDGVIRTDQSGCIYGDRFRGSYHAYGQYPNESVIYYDFKFPSKVAVWCYDHNIYVMAPSSITQSVSNYYRSINCDLTYVLYGGNSFTSNSAQLYTSGSVILNGVPYYYGTLRVGADYFVFSEFDFGSQAEAQQNITNDTPSSMGFSYTLTDSNGDPNQIALLLKSLVGRYVDSNSLNNVTEIIREIPVLPVSDGQGNTVVQAQPTPDNLSELTALINQIIEDDAKWKEFLAEPEPELNPDPDPEPSPNNQGTEVPEDFPTTIFTPINDSVGSMFDFVSIFKPLFYIFSFSTGLLGLWLVVPFVILFLILFRLLK